MSQAHSKKIDKLKLILISDDENSTIQLSIFYIYLQILKLLQFNFFLNLGKEIGEAAGRAAGEETGQEVAVQQAVEAAQKAASEAAMVLLGNQDQSNQIALEVGAKIGQEVARKLGKQMGGNLGAEAGKLAGMEAALNIAKEVTSKENPLDMDENKMKALKVCTFSLQYLKFKFRIKVFSFLSGSTKTAFEAFLFSII